MTVIRKKSLQLGICLTLCFLILGGLSLSAEAKKNVVLLESDDWPRGDSEGLQLTEDGQLTLSHQKEGFFITPPIEPEVEFTHLVPFWNVTTPPDTQIDIKAKLKIEKKWSRWIRVATWRGNKPHTYSYSSSKVETKIDTLSVNNRKANKFKLLIELSSKTQDIAPSVRLVGATYWDSSKKPGITGAKVTGYLKDLEVPKESQFKEPASIAPLICSPTALSMVLHYYGKQVEPLEVARGVYDHGAEIYGNWSLNTAFAASYGFQAYVRYFPSIEAIKEEIAADRPVVVSIAYDKGELKGAPMESTSGHLVVVRGFLKKEDKEYLIVNDPAAKKDKSVRRTYRLDQFISAWKGIGYVIRPLS
ncbi:peptidase C39 family protein [Candidatus Bipolaricaulota bacterium]|nr:peptidase C39 family protein [Candidatus Bipolaricaulota bacterium]